MVHRVLLCAASVTLCFSIGCGGSGPSSYDVAPVTGSVKLDGQPLTNVAVVFTPVASEGITEASMLGPGSMGITDSSGNFTLSIPTTGQSGAVVGSHEVTINYVDVYDDEETDELPEEDPNAVRIPRRYNEETKLKFTVPDNGTDSAHFELDSKPGPPPAGGGYGGA